MARTVRTPITLAIESRRTRIAEAYLQGYRSVRSIATAIGSSPATVTRDLQSIRKEWKEAMIADFDAARSEEIQRLDRMEREAWSAWERSKTVREKTKTTRVQKAAKAPKGDAADAGQSTAEVSRENLLGDPRYLERIGWCVDRRIKLLGLDAPGRHEVTGAGGRPIEIRTADQLTDDELAAIAAGGSEVHDAH